MNKRQENLLAETSRAVNLNLIAMYRALGGGSQIREDKDFVPEAIQQTMRERTDWAGCCRPSNFPKTQSHRLRAGW
ncbi:MAG: hypothetical protein JSU72_03565 [Deltaproteobacteria bacterium]|nr:MAG: hypothetical protein JSU72_03565 [Deltaproteobacteria bacterium]